ncbi:hypothetical protein [Pseudomonas aeruginosa]|uniref:hypothetical protein n=1 Tax=Pseudomonas aeruginosa TaxID=287 RepID=UPI003FD335DC
MSHLEVWMKLLALEIEGRWPDCGEATCFGGPIDGEVRKFFRGVYSYVHQSAGQMPDIGFDPDFNPNSASLPIVSDRYELDVIDDEFRWIWRGTEN